MGCCKSKHYESGTSKNRQENQARAQVYLAPSATDETEKEQGATDTSHAWLEQLAINLPEVDEEEQRIWKENFKRYQRPSETEQLLWTDIFRLADVLKPVSKEDYEGKWFSRLLTDHTFEVNYDKRLDSFPIEKYINAVGLQGIIPDRAQVSIIHHDYHPSFVTIITGRVRNDRLWKCTWYEFGSYLWINEPNRYEFHDYRVLSYQTPSFPLVAPSSTWGQVDEHIKENSENQKWKISRISSRKTKLFRVRKNQEVAQICLTFQGHIEFRTQVHHFHHLRGWKFEQGSVFLMTGMSAQELDGIFKW